MKKKVKKVRNSEGYYDPTAGKAIRNAEKENVPAYIRQTFKILNEVAGLMGLEVVVIRDRKTKKVWKK